MKYELGNGVCQEPDDAGTSEGWDKDRKQYPAEPPVQPPPPPKKDAPIPKHQENE